MSTYGKYLFHFNKMLISRLALINSWGLQLTYSIFLFYSNKKAISLLRELHK